MDSLPPILNEPIVTDIGSCARFHSEESSTVTLRIWADRDKTYRVVVRLALGNIPIFQLLRRVVQRQEGMYDTPSESVIVE